MPQTKAWFFNQISLDLKKTFEPGDEIDIQIMRVGNRNHQVYGKVEVSQQTLEDVVSNFENRERGVDLVVDENHEDDHKALWIFRRLRIEWDSLFANIELTRKGADKLTNWEYFYFSPEIIFGPFKDDETWVTVKNLLIGGAFTNRPFFKKMEPVMASEGSSGQQDDNIYLFLFESKMEKFRELLEAAKGKTLSFWEKYALLRKFEELSEEEQKEAQNEVDEVVNAKPEPTTDPEPKGDDDDGDDAGDDDNKEAVEASEKYKSLEGEVVKLRTQVKLQEVEKKFNENFACTKENPTGIFNESKQKAKFTSFYVTLNERQQKMFDELISGVDVNLPGKFSEEGQGTSKDNGVSTKEQKYMEAVNKVMAEQSIPFHEAVNHVDYEAIE